MNFLRRSNSRSGFPSCLALTGNYRRGGLKPRPYSKKLLLEMKAQEDVIVETDIQDKIGAKAQLAKTWSERHDMMIEVSCHSFLMLQLPNMTFRNTGKEMQRWQDEQMSDKRENLEALYERRHQR